MRVYRFLDEKYGLKSLRERRLRISRILELNDPFEMLAISVNERNFRAAFMKGRAEIAKQSGLVCFSRNWRSPVQWAHYTNKHRGLCLGFDVPDSFLEQVTYVEKRLPINTPLDENLVRKLLTTKFSHWQYEEEHRAFVPLREAEGKHYFIDFGETLSLKEVMVGTYSAITRAKLRKALGSLTKEVDAFRVRPGFKDFEIVRQQKESMWK